MCTHLQKRGNRYYFRRRVPLDLVGAYRRRELSCSLGTGDYADAKVRCRKIGARFDDEFDSVRAGGIPTLLDSERLNHQGASEPIALPLIAEASQIAPFETAPPSPPPRISLTKLADKWEAERKPDGRSVAAMRRVIRRFEQMVGKLAAPAITKAHAIQFKDKLLESGQTAVNTNKQLDVLNALLNYGVANNHMEVNPARGVKVAVKRKAKDARHPFDLPALQAIFGGSVYTKGEYPEHIGYEASHWIPLLALFYGARREELCQLRPEDVYEETYLDANGADARVWVLRITDSEDKSQGVKTVESVRRVPLHAELVARGFLDFVARQKGKSRLFSHLKADEHGDEGAAFGKWFSKYLRNECRVKNRKMVFHSFRHSFKDHCRALEIPEEVSDALSGHSSGKVSRDYGGLSYPLRPLVDAVQRYRVPGLNLPPAPGHVMARSKHLELAISPS